MEQQSEPLAQAWPRTLQLPPGKLAQLPAVQVLVQQSPAPEHDLPTSEQTLSEHVPLLQLLRQHSVLPVHESPLTLQNGVELHTVRFQQTSGGRRVVWSQIDVLVGGREVRLINATVVPVKRGDAAAAEDLKRPCPGDRPSCRDRP